jgi:hypothetical protein
MTERDAFEVRFHAAVRDYAGHIATDLDAVEFASRIASSAPRRHGVVSTVQWRGAAIPRRAWVPLLLAGLLGALVGGLLIAGAQPQRKLPAVLPPVGTTFTCPPGSTPDKPGPVDQARPVNPGLAAFDRRAGRLVALTAVGGGVETWTFDVCANTWTQMHPNREPSSLDWRPLVYDVDSDVTILISSGKVWTYDLQADAWSEKGVAPTDATPWVYDPRSGFVVAARYVTPADLWNYDVETDAWIPQANAPSDSNPPYVVYDASVDRIIAPGGLFDLRSGTWSTSGAEMPRIIAGYGWQAPKIVYDETAERTVVFGNGRMIAYDATADRWEILQQGSPVVYDDVVDLGPNRLSFQDGTFVAYDPVNGRLIGWYRRDADQEGFAAYDLASRQWTVLLEPGKGQATPQP